MAEIRKVLIAGGSGFVGRALALQLKSADYGVSILSRNVQKAKLGLPFAEVIDWESLATTSSHYDAIINLAGTSIASGRWTQSRKEKLMSSRLQTTEALVSFCQNTQNPPTVFINASAIGYYGDHGQDVISEDTKPNDCFSHRLCSEWEKTLTPLRESTSIRLCIARFGVVIAAKGGAFSQMALPFKCKVALQNGEGNQWFSWVSLEDAVNALQWMLESDAACDEYNVTSPQPIKNSEFTKHLANKFETKISLKIPAKILQLMLGQMANELILSSQRVVPDQLLEEGFKFKHVVLDELIATW